MESGFEIVCISSGGVSQFHAPAPKSVRETGKQLEKFTRKFSIKQQGEKGSGIFHIKVKLFERIDFHIVSALKICCTISAEQ
jgi:hypothetical protein